MSVARLSTDAAMEAPKAPARRWARKGAGLERALDVMGVECPLHFTSLPSTATTKTTAGAGSMLLYWGGEDAAVAGSAWHHTVAHTAGTQG